MHACITEPEVARFATVTDKNTPVQCKIVNDRLYINFYSSVPFDVFVYWALITALGCDIELS